MRPLILLFFSVVLFSACQSAVTDSLRIEELLFKKLAREEAVVNFFGQFPHAYVSQNDHCEGTDCEQNLRDAGINVPVYSREAAFMRALRQNMVIVEINTTAEVPYLKYRLEGEKMEPKTGTVFI